MEPGPQPNPEDTAPSPPGPVGEEGPPAAEQGSSAPIVESPAEPIEQPEAPPPLNENPDPDPIYSGYTRFPPPPSMSSVGESNYPRYYPTSEGPVPPGPPTVRFGAIGQAWDLLQQDFAVYAFASLIMIVLDLVSYYGVQIALERHLPADYHSMWMPYDFSNPSFWGWSFVISVAERIVPFYLGAGFFAICLKRLRGERISVGQVFLGFKPFFGMLIAAILVLGLEIGGCLLFLLPGMFAVGVLAFVPQIMMDQHAGPVEAIQLSFMALKKDWVFMWLLAFVTAVIAFAGALACGVGAVFTAPVYYMVLALHYHAYFPAQGGPQRLAIPNVAPQPA